MANCVSSLSLLYEELVACCLPRGQGGWHDENWPIYYEVENDVVLRLPRNFAMRQLPRLVYNIQANQGVYEENSDTDDSGRFDTYSVESTVSTASTASWPRVDGDFQWDDGYQFESLTDWIVSLLKPIPIIGAVARFLQPSVSKALKDFTRGLLHQANTEIGLDASDRVQMITTGTSAITSQEAVPVLLGYKALEPNKPTVAMSVVDTPSQPGPAVDRFYPITTFQWDSTSMFSQMLWSGWLQLDLMYQYGPYNVSTPYTVMSERHAYQNPGFVVNVTVNGTQFHQGCLLIVVIPEASVNAYFGPDLNAEGSSTSTNVDSSTMSSNFGKISAMNFRQLMLFPHQLLNIRTNNAVNVKVPYIGLGPMTDFRVHQPWWYGIFVIESLAYGTGATTMLTVEVAAAPQRPFFHGMHYPIPNDFPRTGVDKSKLFPEEDVSKPKYSTEGLPVRVISNFNSFSTTGNLDEVIVLAKEAQTVMPVDYLPEPNTDFLQPATVPTLITVFPPNSTCSSVTPDPGAIKWCTTDKSGVNLATIWATPVSLMSENSYLGNLSQLFSQWTGTLEFSFLFTGTQKHRGRLVVAFTPATVQGPPPSMAAAMQSTYTIWDIGLNSTLTFPTPYMSSTVWRPTIPFVFNVPEYIPGYVTVWVYNMLTAPANVPLQTHVFVFLSAGSDFSLRLPRRPDFSYQGDPVLDTPEALLEVTTQDEQVSALGNVEIGSNEAQSASTVWSGVQGEMRPVSSDTSYENFYSRGRWYHTYTLPASTTASAGQLTFVDVKTVYIPLTFLKEPCQQAKTSSPKCAVGDLMSPFSDLYAVAHLQTYCQADLRIDLVMTPLVRPTTMLKYIPGADVEISNIPPGSYVNEQSLGDNLYPTIMVPVSNVTSNVSIYIPYQSFYNVLPLSFYSGYALTPIFAGGKRPNYFESVWSRPASPSFGMLSIRNLSPVSIEIVIYISFHNAKFWFPRPFPNMNQFTKAIPHERVPFAKITPARNRRSVAPDGEMPLLEESDDESVDVIEEEAGEPEKYYCRPTVVKVKRKNYMHWGLAYENKVIELERESALGVRVVQNTVDSKSIAVKEVPMMRWQHACRMVGHKWSNYNAYNNCTTFVESVTGLKLQNTGKYIMAGMGAIAAAVVIGCVFTFESAVQTLPGAEKVSYESPGLGDTINRIDIATASISQAATAMKGALTKENVDGLTNMIKDVSNASKEFSSISGQFGEFLTTCSRLLPTTVEAPLRSMAREIAAAILKFVSILLLIFANPTPTTIAAVFTLLTAEAISTGALEKLVVKTGSIFGTLCGFLSAKCGFGTNVLSDPPPEVLEVANAMDSVVENNEDESSEEKATLHSGEGLKTFNNVITAMKNTEYLLSKLQILINWIRVKFDLAVEGDPDLYCERNLERIWELYSESEKCLTLTEPVMAAVECNVASVEQMLKVAMKAKNISYRMTLTKAYRNFLRAQCQLHSKRYQARAEPLVCYLYGAPGCGKSVAAELLARGVCRHFGWNPQEQIFSQPFGSQFFDGYTAQKVHLIDDLGQDPEGEDYKNFAQMVSTTRFTPPMADVAQKGNPYEARVIIATSNFSSTNPNTARCPGALERRLHNKYRVQPVPRYSDSRGYIDVASVTTPVAGQAPLNFRRMAPILTCEGVIIEKECGSQFVKTTIPEMVMDLCAQANIRTKVCRGVLDLCYEAGESESLNPITVQPVTPVNEDEHPNLTTYEEFKKFVLQYEKDIGCMKRCMIVGTGLSIVALGVGVFSWLLKRKGSSEGAYGSLVTGNKTIPKSQPEKQQTAEWHSASSYPQIGPVICKNTFSIKFINEDTQLSTDLTGVGLCDRIFLCNWHGMQNATMVKARGLECKISDMAVCRIFRGDIKFPTDLCLAQFPKGDQFRDIRQHMMRLGANVPHDSAIMYVRSEKFSCDVMVSEPSDMATVEVNGGGWLSGVMQYVAATRPGFCGAPVVSTHAAKELLLGVHSAGRGNGRGVGSILYREDVDSYMVQHPVERLEAERKWLEKANQRIHMPAKTHIKQSPAYGAYPVEKEPAVLHPKDKRLDPTVDFREVLAARYKGDSVKPWKNLELAVDVYKNKLFQLVGKCRTLTVWEAINGFENLDPMDMSQSPGYPYNSQGKSRRSLFQRFGDGYIPCDELNIEIERALRSPDDYIFTEFLKDELRSLDKIKTGNTRVIHGDSLPRIIAARMLFGDFFSKMLGLTGPKLMCAVGCNPDVHYTEWFGRLHNSLICGDMDYKNFDYTVPTVLFDSLAQVLEPCIEDPRAYPMIRAYAHSRIIQFDDIYQEDGGMPSGCVGTSIFNSIMNSLVVLSAFYSLDPKTDHIVEAIVLTYGDDVIFGTNSVELHPRKVADWIMENTPFQVTCPEGVWKDTPCVFDLKFLKRKFVLDPRFPPLVHPQIDAQVYQQSVMWTRSEDFQQVLDCLALLAYHGGPITYQIWKERVMQKLTDNGFGSKYYLPAFKFLDAKWLSEFGL